MLSTEYRATLDKIWSGFLLASESNHFAVLDLINTLLFLKQLDQIDAEKGKLSVLSGEPVENPIYTQDQQDLRWQSFHYLDNESLFQLVYQRNGVLEFVKNLPQYNTLRKFNKEEHVLVPPPYLLAEMVSLINKLNVPDDDTREEMINYLLQKSETAKKISSPRIARPVQKIIHIADEPEKRYPSFKLKLSKTVSILLVFSFCLVTAITFAYFNWDKLASTVSNIEKPVLKEFKVDDTSSIASRVNSKTQFDTTTTYMPMEKVPKRSIPTDTVNTQNKPFKENIAAPSKSNKTLAKARVDDRVSTNEAQEKTNEENTGTAATKERYKIIDKAYFHNQPDESTRRNAFVNHWNNSYATLQPLDEKNGFIYVEFRNHLNQTSKGWLRKKDLKPIE